MNEQQTRCAPSPRLRGEGWGEGGFRSIRPLERPPHPALRADLSPQAGRGGARGASAIISRAVKILAREALVILALLVLAGPALAQDYPTRPIRALTTTSAGGISDIFMRALGDELLKRWGQPIVVENRPGGMQNLGARACSEALPDGYTICILNAEPIAYNQFLLKNMPFDPEKGVQPVTNLYHLIQTLVVNSQLNVKTIDELIALSKAKPGTLNYVTAAVPLALYMETLKKEQGADWVRVPFKGGGEAVNAVLSGSTPIALIGEGNVIGQIRAGTMTPLVMLNNIRSPNFPDVPTLAETGYTGPPSRSWYGLFTPAGTPRPIVDKLANAVAAIVDDPTFRERHLSARSLVPAINTPDQFAAEIRKDRALAQEVVKAAGLEPQ
jgi:tripartite-type tricarboxylate transporter receptor subunit TctC